MSGAPLLAQLCDFLAIALYLSVNFFLMRKVVSDGSVNLFKRQRLKIFHDAFR
jgi:hypothetical protein